MKLIGIIPPPGISLPGLSPRGMFTLWLGRGTYADWKVELRGPSVFLVAPPEFQTGEVKPASGAQRVYEIARSACHLIWDLPSGGKLEDAAPRPVKP